MHYLMRMKPIPCKKKDLLMIKNAGMRTGIAASIIFSSALLCSLFHSNNSRAQVSASSIGRNGSVYISIGTNSPSYQPTTIHVDQGAGNTYDLQEASADKTLPGNSSILNYNFRVGYYFNKKQTMGVELNYDPVSYHLVDGQNVQMVGTFGDNVVNKPFTFSSAAGYSYYLNGSNLVLVNFVKRFGIFRDKLNYFAVDALAKAGVGPAMPRVLNTFEGKTVDQPSFQLGGWNAGLEAALRITVVRHAYLEFAWKYDRASYSNININNGSVSHNLSLTEYVFSLGYTFSTTKHNPLFEKKKKPRKVLTIGNINHGDE